MTDYNTYKLSLPEWIRYGVTGLIIAIVIAYVFYRHILVFIFLSPLAIIYPLYKRKELLIDRKHRLSVQFREGITVLAASLSAGYSMENAMKESAAQLKLLYGADGMIVKEFNYIASRVHVNVPIEKAWEEFAKRSGLEDISNYTRVLQVAKRSGGQLCDIIARTADVIGDKIKIKEEILTMTAAKRLEQKIMNMIPILIVLYIDISSPGFFSLMYTTWMGRVIMTACLVAYLGAYLLAAKILTIEV